jgi:hypothetical protein
MMLWAYIASDHHRSFSSFLYDYVAYGPFLWRFGLNPPPVTFILDPINLRLCLSKKKKKKRKNKFEPAFPLIVDKLDL